MEARHWSATSFEVPVDEARRRFYSSNGHGGLITSSQRLSSDFVCPYHSCTACALRLDTKPPTPFVRCGLCYKSYHRNCFVQVMQRGTQLQSKQESRCGDKETGGGNAAEESRDSGAPEPRGVLHVIKLADDSTICCPDCQHKLSEEKRKRSSAGVCMSLLTYYFPPGHCRLELTCGGGGRRIFFFSCFTHLAWWWLLLRDVALVVNSHIWCARRPTVPNKAQP